MASTKVKQKREKIRNDILLNAVPLIEDGTYSQLTIRELCEKIGITTGMFYRSYQSKDDLLAYFTTERCKELYEASRDTLAGIPLRERLLRICLLSMQSLTATGPDSILIYSEIANENSTHSYQVSRDLFQQQLQEAFAASCAEGSYTEADVLNVTDSLFTFEAGLCFEWHIMQNNPDFDFAKRSQELLWQMIKDLKLPDDQ